jgi:hypothetical protein
VEARTVDAQPGHDDYPGLQLTMRTPNRIHHVGPLCRGPACSVWLMITSSCAPRSRAALASSASPYRGHQRAGRQRLDPDLARRPGADSPTLTMARPTETVKTFTPTPDITSAARAEVRPLPTSIASSYLTL